MPRRDTMCGAKHMVEVFLGKVEGGHPLVLCGVCLGQAQEDMERQLCA